MTECSDWTLTKSESLGQSTTEEDDDMVITSGLADPISSIHKFVRRIAEVAESGI